MRHDVSSTQFAFMKVEVSSMTRQSWKTDGKSRKVGACCPKTSKKDQKMCVESAVNKSNQEVTQGRCIGF